MDYQQRLADMLERIAKACHRAGRDPKEVTIIAVTKYIGVEETEALIRAGVRHIGENRLQVAEPKLERFPRSDYPDLRWHYIGSLQTNKAKEVLERFDLIHSLDRLSLAKELQKRAMQLGRVIPCLVQVNVSGEASKGGLTPAEVADFLRAVSAMQGLAIQGYMTMAPQVDDPEQTRGVFRKLRELRDELLNQGVAPKTAVHLSMGMSNDFEVAVEEGATFVRIGRVLVNP